MGVYPVAIARLFIGRGPDSVDVVGRRALNGVEDDVSAIFDYGDCMATLGTSFRCKLQNWAYIIGEESYIAIPDFWRASECRLYHLDDCVDRYQDGRASLGFNYETVAANEDILAGRQQNRIMTWNATVRFQEHMDRVRELF